MRNGPKAHWIWAWALVSAWAGCNEIENPRRDGLAAPTPSDEPKASDASTTPDALPSGTLDIVPEESRTTWAPGVQGIPARSTICANLAASTFGGAEASAAIQAAIDACPAGQVVRLSEGTFTLNDHVLINKGITLRGAGPGRTVLQKTNQGAEQEQLVIVGPSRWPHIDESTAVDLEEDATKGAMSVTVRSTAGFAPGQFVRLDEDDYTTATFVTLPPRLDGSTYRILATDRLVWPINDPPRAGNLPVPGGLSWHSRPGRPLSEIKEVARVDDRRVTFSTPIHITYRKANAAQLTRFTGDAAHIRDAGVEDLTLTGGSEGNVSFSSAAYSWAKNIECTRFGIPCVDITHSFRLEIRDSYIHDTIHPYPGGGGYALSLQQGSSEILIENNIIMGANKVIVVRSAGAGSVVGYNYMDNAFIGNYADWMEVGLNASHMLGSHHVLFEGNLSFNYDSDDTWGGSLAMTIFRNHLTGDRRDFPDEANVRAGGLGFGSWWHAFIGNVMGVSTGMPNWVYEDPGDQSLGHSTSMWGGKAIWRLGYAPGSWGQAPDPKVRSTVVRDGNFDYVSGSVHWDRAQRTLPDSLYLAAKPAFFGDLPWPWVDPTGPTKTYALPAHRRYEAMIAATSRLAPFP
jgi:hypothetical protein